jgi:hypothetical protein
MTNRLRFGAVIVVLGLGMTGDLFACGDKFLVGGRGTRYQRPKNARAASVLIYAEPASGVQNTLKKNKVESLLKLEGHRSTTVQTFEQLSTIVSSGRYDVILTANSATADVQKLLGAVPEAAIVLPVEDLATSKTILQAIDKAVVQRDQNLKKAQARTS